MVCVVRNVKGGVSHLFLGNFNLLFFGSEGNDRAVRGETWTSCG